MSDAQERDDGRATRSTDRDVGDIVNPEDLPPQVEVTERDDGVTRIDIADDATTRPGEPDPVDGSDPA